MQRTYILVDDNYFPRAHLIDFKDLVINKVIALNNLFHVLNLYERTSITTFVSKCAK